MPLKAKDIKGNITLYNAVYKSHKIIVYILFNSGVNINIRINKRRTLLKCAGVNRYTKVIKLLLENNIGVNQKTGKSGSIL